MYSDIVVNIGVGRYHKLLLISLILSWFQWYLVDIQLDCQEYIDVAIIFEYVMLTSIDWDWVSTI